jgi:hypothetical protein
MANVAYNLVLMSCGHGSYWVEYTGFVKNIDGDLALGMSGCLGGVIFNVSDL